jgi:hypothetical protein
MSLIDEVGSRVYSASAQLPLGEVVAAVERLRSAAALLAWVAQDAGQPIGESGLTSASEHLETAGRALQVTQDALSQYLASVGLAFDASAPPDTAWRRALDEPKEQPLVAPVERGAVPPLGRWWSKRVAELTDGPEITADGEPKPGSGADLLREVAKLTRAEDRSGLRRALGEAAPPTGLGLSAITPPILHRLAGDLLGHQPTERDLEDLRKAARDQARAMLPKLPPEVLDAHLARICRAPVEPPKQPTHPTDAAVTGAVLVGVLLRRLGRDPDSLDPGGPERVPEPRSNADADD